LAGASPRSHWGSLQCSPYPLAVFRGTTSKGRGGEGEERRGGEGRERRRREEKRGEKGREGVDPLP